METVISQFSLCTVQIPNFEKQFFGVNLLLRGIERINGKAKKQAPPITPELLIMMHGVMNLDSPFELTMWALFLTCFFLMLRKSNVMPVSNNLDEKFLQRKILKEV